jgi:hypothetical protein
LEYADDEYYRIPGIGVKVSMPLLAAQEVNLLEIVA